MTTIMVSMAVESFSVEEKGPKQPYITNIKKALKKEHKEVCEEEGNTGRALLHAPEEVPSPAQSLIKQGVEEERARKWAAFIINHFGFIRELLRLAAAWLV